MAVMDEPKITISMVGPRLTRINQTIGKWVHTIELWWKTRHMHPLHQDAVLRRSIEAANDYFEHEAWRAHVNADRVAAGKKPL